MTTQTWDHNNLIKTYKCTNNKNQIIKKVKITSILNIDLFREIVNQTPLKNIEESIYDYTDRILADRRPEVEVKYEVLTIDENKNASGFKIRTFKKKYIEHFYVVSEIIEECIPGAIAENYPLCESSITKITKDSGFIKGFFNDLLNSSTAPESYYVLNGLFPTEYNKELNPDLQCLLTY